MYRKFCCIRRCGIFYAKLPSGQLRELRTASPSPAERVFLAAKSRSERLEGTFWAVFAWTFPMLREVPF